MKSENRCKIRKGKKMLKYVNDFLLKATLQKKVIYKNIDSG